MHTSLSAGISVQWWFRTDHGDFSDGFLCYASLEAAKHEERQGPVLKLLLGSSPFRCLDLHVYILIILFKYIFLKSKIDNIKRNVYI